MGYVEAALTIHVPVDVVWNCLNDIDRTPEWVTGLEYAEVTTGGRYGLGSVYADTNRFGLFLQVTPWRITVFEPLTRQVHVSTSAILPSRMILNLLPIRGGTYLQMIVEYSFLPRLGPAGRMLEDLFMNRLLKQVLTQDQANLNEYLTCKLGQATAIQFG